MARIFLNIPPAPIRDPITSPVWVRWFQALQALLTNAQGLIPWLSVSKEGSQLSEIESRPHNDLQTIQGGAAGDYYHLTGAQASELTDGGATTLHKHDHGEQDGLADDDHAQYLRTDGTRDSTGEQVFRAGEAIRTQFGIKVENAGSKSYGWRDLLGSINVKGTGGGGVAANPDYVAYRGSLYAYRFGTNAPNNHLHEAFIEYHVPHDWVVGSDAHIHIHWSLNVAGTGNAKWYFDISYADGHGTPGGAADPFIAPITVSVVQQASTTQYGHMIGEVQFTNNGGTGGLIDSNSIQVDGLFLVRVYRDPGDVADTLNQDAFVHFVDIHYQSNNMATLNKEPNFYG